MTRWFRTIPLHPSGSGRTVMLAYRTINNDTVYCRQIDQTATRSGHLSLRCVNFPDSIRSVLDPLSGSYAYDNTSHFVRRQDEHMHLSDCICTARLKLRLGNCRPVYHSTDSGSRIDARTQRSPAPAAAVYTRRSQHFDASQIPRLAAGKLRRLFFPERSLVLPVAPARFTAGRTSEFLAARS